MTEVSLQFIVRAAHSIVRRCRLDVGAVAPAVLPAEAAQLAGLAGRQVIVFCCLIYLMRSYLLDLPYRDIWYPHNPVKLLAISGKCHPLKDILRELNVRLLDTEVLLA
jgi:hypothetical protein